MATLSETANGTCTSLYSTIMVNYAGLQVQLNTSMPFKPISMATGDSQNPHSPDQTATPLCSPAKPGSGMPSHPADRANAVVVLYPTVYHPPRALDTAPPRMPPSVETCRST